MSGARYLDPVSHALGLPFDEAVLAASARRSERQAISTPSYHYVTQPLYGHARGRWRGLGSSIGPILPRLDLVSVAFGYPSALTTAV